MLLKLLVKRCKNPYLWTQHSEDMNASDCKRSRHSSTLKSPLSLLFGGETTTIIINYWNIASSARKARRRDFVCMSEMLRRFLMPLTSSSRCCRCGGGGMGEDRGQQIRRWQICHRGVRELLCLLIIQLANSVTLKQRSTLSIPNWIFQGINSCHCGDP